MNLFDLSSLNNKIYEYEREIEQPNFWDDQKKAQHLLKELKILRTKVERLENLNNEWEELTIMMEIAEEEYDKNISEEIRKGINTLSKDIETFNLEIFLRGEFDQNSAIISLHPGAGGTESQDWAEMLLRMYTRWAEKKGYKVKILDFLPGDEAGVKSVTLLCEGINAYGFLKGEKGVHRLVRISPFDSSGRRHTSFASVDIMPEIDESVEVDINPEDLKVDTYRASGAGGQHVNKTESAVRITHIPTGIIVQCQNERSQHQNKEVSMKLLMSKLIELKEREQKEKIEDLKGDYTQIAWGNQIRSYVFHPYNMVKDHRTKVEVGNIQSVMDGEIDFFINAFLKYKCIQDN